MPKLSSPKPFFSFYCEDTPACYPDPEAWRVLKTFDGLQTTMIRFIKGELDATPLHYGPICEDHTVDMSDLVKVNRAGFVTIEGQAGILHDVVPRTLKLSGPIRWILPTVKSVDYIHIRQAPYLVGLCRKSDADKVYNTMTLKGYCVVMGDSSGETRGSCTGCVRGTQEDVFLTPDNFSWPPTALRDGWHCDMPQWEDIIETFVEESPDLKSVLQDCVTVSIASKVYGPGPLLQDLFDALTPASGSIPSAADAAAPGV